MSLSSEGKMSVFKEGWENYKALWTAEKYVGFKGRASRREYWTTILIIFITSLIVSIPDWIVRLAIGYESGFSLFSSIYSISILLPTTALTFRRLHDVGRSGWLVISEYIVSAVAGISICSAVIAGYINMTFSRSLWFADASMIALLLFGIVLALASLTLSIIIFVFTLLKGQSGPNRYGEAPSQYQVVVLPKDDDSGEECCCCCSHSEEKSDDEITDENSSEDGNNASSDDSDNSEN